MGEQNLQIVLAERPTGEIVPGKTFNQKTEPVPQESDLKEGEILVQNLYLSLDPAMRGWLSDRRSYVPPVQIGEVMRGATVGKVLASRSSRAKPGDFVSCFGGWQEYSVVGEDKFEPPAKQPAHLTDLLSVLGMTGLTAYFGLLKIGDPKPGDLVVVSGAAGATGSVVGQIAKIKGARVVGLAGTDEKVRFLTEELGFDVGLNYKDKDFRKKFNEATKDHIDVYFDNVGGEILDMALAQAKPFSRFVMCGGISQYNSTDVQGPKNIMNVVTMRIKMQGFIVFDFIKEYASARKELDQWLEEGKIKRRETVVKGGLKVAEQTLVDLYKGINTGKLIVEIRNPQDASKL